MLLELTDGLLDVDLLELAHVRLATEVVLQEQVPNGAIVLTMYAHQFQDCLFVNDTVKDDCHAVDCRVTLAALQPLLPVTEHISVVARCSLLVLVLHCFGLAAIGFSLKSIFWSALNLSFALLRYSRNVFGDKLHVLI